MFTCNIASHAFLYPLGSICNCFQCQKIFLYISFNQRLTGSLLPVIVFLKIYFVFIYKWHFHRVLNSRSAFQRFQSLVCWPLLFLWRSLSLQGICLFSGIFSFLAAFIIFLFVLFLAVLLWYFCFVCFFLFWFAFSYFLVACLIIFALEPRNYVWSTA